MNKVLPIVLAFWIGSLGINALASNTPANSDDLQQQLQKLQQAINQSRQPTPGPQVTPATPASLAGAGALPLAPNQQPARAANTTSQLMTPSAVPPTTNESLPATTPVAGQQASPINRPALTVAPPPNQATPPSADTGGDISSEAFSRMTNTALPLSPNQIEMLHALYDATQQAASAYPGVPPRPTSSSVIVNLSPGATPPIVRLSAGFVTSLVFVDSTGAPWPIASYSIGNPTAFDVKWDQKSNILLVQAITSHRTANMAVILKGLDTPVMVELQPGQAAVDMRVDLRIPGLGPNAKPVIAGLPGTGSPYLLDLLNGIPPSGSKELQVSACDDCAWLYGGKLYLRTQFTVISPAWISTMSSADGTNVYEMQPAPVILATYNGKTIKMVVQGF